MKKRIFAFMVVLAMVFSIMPMSIATVSAATNLISANKTVLYSAVDNWSTGNYSSYSKDSEGVYTIPVTGSTGSKSQAFRVNDLPLELNTTYILSVEAKTDGTFADVKFHNGHSCLEVKSTTVLGATSIGAGWTELKYAITLGLGSNASDSQQCNPHGLLKPYGGTKNPVMHAGVYFKSANDCTLQVRNFSFVKVGELSVTPSMTATEDVGSTAEIIYTFSSAPAAAPTASDIEISGGTGSVAGITKVSDTVYTVALSGLARESKYTVTLSGLTDSEFGLPLPSCPISFTTQGVKELPEGVFVDEDFDSEAVGSKPYFFNGGTVELKSGSTTDKVVALTTNTSNTSTLGFSLPEAITADDGVVEFSFDYFRKNNTSQLMRFYLQNGNVISGQIKASQFETYPSQGILGTPTQSGWNHMSVRVNLANQVYTVAVNGKVTCDESGMAKEFTFRNNVTSISSGYLNMDANATTQTIFIDNFRVAKIDGDINTLVNMDFEGTSTGFSGGTSGYATIETKIDDNNAANGVESGKAMQLNQNVITGDSTSTAYSLSTPAVGGVVDVTFDLYKEANSPRIQFYFGSSTSRNVVSSPINTNGVISEHSNANSGAAVSLGKWTTVTYRMNLYKKTFSVIVDGKEYATTTGGATLNFRDALAENLSKLTIYCDKPSAQQTGKIQIDNLRFTTDVTNRHISITGGNGIVINQANKTLSDCPIGTDIGSFISSLTTTPAGTTVSVYSADGALKSDTDVLEKYDVVWVAYSDVGRIVKYTVLPDYSVDFIGIAVNGNEYYEASKIIEPGEATVRAKIVNNTADEKTFTVYASVVGDKLYDVDLQKDITVAGGGTDNTLKFNVDLPDQSADVKLKLIMVDATDGLTPVSEAETNLVYTSQITRMPNVFSDHMVLQRNEPVNIFGWAPTGTDITVSFGEYSATGIAADGKFCVQLPSMAADSTGKDLVVKAGDTTFTYTDVVVGEVLYGSGQSNMQMGVSSFTGAVSLGQIPNIRSFTSLSLYTTSGRVDDTVSEAWVVRDSSNWKGVSAPMYCTAYYLRELGAIPEDVIIGVVTASWGGTGIAMWLPAEILEKGPNAAYYSSYLNRTPDTKGVRNTDLYSAMAKSIVPYTAKAAVWYQGEHDSGVTTYNWYMDEMVKLMRAEFGKDIPYYAVQLPGFTTSSWAQFRLTQWKSHNPENGVNVVVTNDTGDNSDIHPHDKDVVGERIARHIAYQTYGVEVPYQGPVFKDATVSGNQVTISFDYVNDGLHGGLCSLADDNSLTKFEVSADGTTWYEGTAQIVGDTIVVSSDSVTAPEYVRYGYIDKILKSAGSNSNGVKLPMAPFSEEI